MTCGTGVAYFSQSLQANQLVVWITLWLLHLAVWLWWRAQGLGVMLARNGREVMNVMLSAAVGRTKAMDIDRCSRYLA